MEKEGRRSIIKTLSYADVFDYPLTKEEIWRFLISTTSISKNRFEKVLYDFNSKDGYYYLKDRESIVNKRRKREEESKKKLELAKRISLVLSVIPSVVLIGVSGNLAMRNAKKSDDIDFFIIAKKNTLWRTRLLLIILLKILGKHRSKLSKKATDLICVNMLVDENSLSIPRSRQNLYTAHEVVQMMPLFEKNNTYQKFIAANFWVKKFLPNSIDVKIKSLNTISSQRQSILECLTKTFQLWYMSKNRSTEFISDTTLAFHPKDYTNKVLKLYSHRLEKYGI